MKVIFAKGSFGKGPRLAGTIQMPEREIYYPAFIHIPSLTGRVPHGWGGGEAIKSLLPSGHMHLALCP